MFLDLDGLNFILAALMFSWSFSRRRLVHGAVVVMVVRSSIKALMDGRQLPGVRCSPPTTHFDDLMMTLIAMVNANGDMVHLAIMPISRWCHAVVKARQGEEELQILEMGLDKVF